VDGHWMTHRSPFCCRGTAIIDNSIDPSTEGRAFNLDPPRLIRGWAWDSRRCARLFHWGSLLASTVGTTGQGPVAARWGRVVS